NWIEKSLGNLVPVVIGMLAALIGLGGIGDKIKEFIKKVQAKVDQAIDKMIAKAVAWVKSLFGKGKDGKPDERTPEQKAKDLKQAMAEANPLIKNKELSVETVSKQLKAIKDKYKLNILEVRKEKESEGGEFDYVYGEINPSERTETVEHKT